MRYSLAAEQANHDELAHDRIAECCQMIGCTPDQLVSHVRMMVADRRDREQEADEQERADLRRWAHMRGVRPRGSGCL